MQASVMLMDEPFSALDYQWKEKNQLVIKDLSIDQKKTIIFVTHDLREALFMSDKIVILRSD
jgi:ABC-type nitrate/sulfonate/bicarbonate transport system ATPase subunit